MNRPVHDPSPLVTLAIALGAVKGTDVIKDILRGQGFGKIPEAAKSVTSTLLAVAGAAIIETNWRSRVLTACSAAGLASLVHSAERKVRVEGDIVRQQVTINAPRVR